ncbi:hypothetical protein CAL65_00100 [Alkalilimnicola ehrlichii]|uniref:Phasin domain-containing protein n=2 Tax=Alkalilimnicola ehrlichii TaxID=351052 RepID=A0A3E0X345_9GAMM|nr:hypothetical protein CAL65_00100 [Alkalilimnicola ehrlichii]
MQQSLCYAAMQQLKKDISQNKRTGSGGHFMFQDVLDRTHAQFAELLAPARKLNGLLLDNIEKLTQFQLEAVRAYSSLGFQQLRASCDISSAQGFQEYLSNQTKVAETLSKS